MIFFFNFLCFLDSFHGSLYWGCQKHSSDFFLGLGRLGGCQGQGYSKCSGGYNPTFLTLRRGTIFQAKGGVQSRTTKAKGGYPPLPLFGQVCYNLKKGAKYFRFPKLNLNMSKLPILAQNWTTHLPNRNTTKNQTFCDH